MNKGLLSTFADDALVKATLDGDHSAFGEIVRRYKSTVARTIKGMLGSCPEADDIGQDTFIRLYQSLGSFRGEAKLSTYIQRIAINQTLNEIKKKKRFVRHFDLDSNGEERQVTIPDDDMESERDNVEVVEKALAMLEPKFRIVLVMRTIQGYDTKETAEALKLPVGTVLSRLSRAQAKMEEIIKTKL